MNELIIELADKAVEDVSTGPWNISDEFCIKFAHLIVRGCGVALSPMLRDMVSRGQAYDLIKQHFGVEDNPIKIGGRVKVVSGFNVGAKGTVKYVEPGGKLWVRRDGTSSDTYHYPEEIIGVEE